MTVVQRRNEFVLLQYVLTLKMRVTKTNILAEQGPVVQRVDNFVQ